MSWLTRTLSSNSGRKMLVAITGLMLVLFLLIHVLGNLQVFSPTDALDEEAAWLHGGPLIYIVDIGMVVLFSVHIALVLWLALDNKRARGPIGYKVAGTKQQRPWLRVLASKYTLYTGLLLLAFLVLHLLQFRLRDHEMGGHVKAEILRILSDPLWAISYIVGSLVTGFHVFHGFQAAFRSLGFNHNRYTPFIEKSGMALGILLGLAFAAIPAWILLAS